MQYRQFLRNRDFFLLWVSQTISQFGDRLNQMALIGVVYETMKASPLALANIFTVAIIPVFLISPIAGVYVDRWNLRKTMLYSDLLRGILIMCIPVLVLPRGFVPGIYVLIFLAFCVGRFFIPAKLSIIPHLVPEEQIVMANSLISTTGMVAAVMGFGIGGIIVEKWGAGGAFVADALTFFVSALLIACMRYQQKKYFRAADLLDLGKQIVVKIKQSFLGELREGLRYIVTSAQTRFVFRSLSVLFACIGALYVVFIIFVQETLGSKTQDLGFLAVCLGCGLFVSSLIYGRVGIKLSMFKTITLGLFLSGVYLIIFVVTLRFFPNTIFAMASSFVLGFVVAPIVIGGSSLIHQDSSNALWGRIFSSLEVVIHFFFLACMYIASFLAERISAFTIIVGVGIIITLIAGFTLFKSKNALNNLSV